MSMSNRARRMLQHQLRHRADAQLNLIPMIDILERHGVVSAGVLDQRRGAAEHASAIQIPQSISEQQPRVRRWW